MSFFSGHWTFLKEKLTIFWRILWHAFMTCIRRGGNVLLWSRSNSFLLECFIAVEVWHVQRVVLLVTHEESASCFIRLQIILAKTCFWWKILSVQNILIVFICQKCTLKNNSFNDIFIVFIAVTYRDSFTFFLVAAINIFFFFFCLNDF